MKLIDKFIDKVAFINLDNRKDRLKKILDEFEPIFSSKKINRISAIKHDIPEIGCLMSHIKTLKYGMDNNFKNLLILEDDAIWNDKYDESVELFKYLYNKNPNFDVILLGGTSSKYDNNYKLENSYSTASYLVNGHYYKTLLDLWENSLKNWDSHKTQCDVSWHKLMLKDNWFIVKPCLIIQSPSYSDILKINVDYKDQF